MKVLFLGYGKMGRALGDTWLKKKLVDKLVAVDPNLIEDEITYFRNIEDVPAQFFDLIIIAVKPTSAKTLLRDLPPTFLKNTCFVSIMAGVEIKSIRKMINHSTTPIIRVMPNTPVVVQAGCCALYTHSILNIDLKKQVDKLFSSVGYTIWLNKEEELHIITALSGSGPAYFHLFTEAIANAGISLGLAPEISYALAKQTTYGTSLLQNQNNSDLAELRENVTSPNGTTYAALQIFEKNSKLRKLTQEALNAAYNRSLELSKI